MLLMVTSATGAQPSAVCCAVRCVAVGTVALIRNEARLSWSTELKLYFRHALYTSGWSRLRDPRVQMPTRGTLYTCALWIGKQPRSWYGPDWRHQYAYLCVQVIPQSAACWCSDAAMGGAPSALSTVGMTSTTQFHLHAASAGFEPTLTCTRPPLHTHPCLPGARHIRLDPRAAAAARSGPGPLSSSHTALKEWERRQGIHHV